MDKRGEEDSPGLESIQEISSHSLEKCLHCTLPRVGNACLKGTSV